MKTRKVHIFLPNGQQIEISVFTSRQIVARANESARTGCHGNSAGKQTLRGKGGARGGEECRTARCYGRFWRNSGIIHYPHSFHETRDVTRESKQWRFAGCCLLEMIFLMIQLVCIFPPNSHQKVIYFKETLSIIQIKSCEQLNE